MATKTENEIYAKIENIIRDRVFILETENAQLRNELAIAQAKLDIYERITSVSDSKITLGFGPPTNKEGGV